MGKFLAIIQIVLLSLVTSCNKKQYNMDIINRFEPKEIVDTKIQKDPLLYRLYTPDNYNKTNKYPLILYLHGGGGRGSDNLAQVEFGAGILISPLVQTLRRSFVLVPQCPKGLQWLMTTFKNRPFLNYQQDSIPESKNMKMVIKLITNLQHEFSIDVTRLYVTGPSMGGSGTWDIITRYPNLFAAAIPINGVSDPSKTDRIAHLPIWAFHGEKDNISDVNNTRNMIRELKKHGSNCQYTEYKNKGHAIDGIAYNESKLFIWLFDQRKAMD